MRLPSSLRQEYEQLSTDRSPYLQRGRDCSKYTLPTLLPPAGRTGGMKLRSGYSNFGARCVNSLSSKMTLAIMPARQSFFRYQVSDELLEQVGGTDLRAEVDRALGKMERVVQDDIEATATRTPVGEAIKHLLVAGNVLVYMLPSGGLKVYALHSYVCMRDHSGNVLRTIAEDRVAPQTLPESIRGAVMAKLVQRNSPDKTVLIYTGVFRQGNHWVVWQEVEGIRVPGSDGTYPMDASPWLPLRFTPVDGESYGRGMVEDYLGYLISLEALTGSLVKGAAIAAKVVFLRKPNGTVRAKALTHAETGDVIDGNPEDVTALQSDKQYDFRTVREMIGDLKEELGYAFALSQAIQRNAERVTAEEIRYMAQELDSLNGGIYSQLSLEFQQPYLRRKTLDLQKSGRLPQLPKKAIRPVIVTGLDALGRGAELDNLKALVQDVVELGGTEALETEVNFGNLVTRLATARGIETDGLIPTAEEKAARQEQKQMAALVEQLGPNAVTQLGQLAKQGMAPQGTQ